MTAAAQAWERIGGRLIDAMWNITVRHSGATRLVCLSGELDMSVRDELVSALLTELNQPGSLVLQADLRAVSFLDSSGIAALAEVKQRATDTGRAFTIVDASDAVRRTLRITGLWTVLST